MFRLIYLTINETLSQTSGVTNKLSAKIAALQKYTDGCRFMNAVMSVDHDEVKQTVVGDLGVAVEIGVKMANRGYLNQISMDHLFYQRLAVFIRSFSEFDRIVMRYPLASSGLRDFTRHFESRVVFEHNTFEIEELRLTIKKRTVPFSLRPSLFFYWFQEMKWPLLAEQFISKEIFSNAHSGACVTTEIASYERRRCRKYRTFVSSNFYAVSDVVPQHLEWREGELLNLGFIVTDFSPWYGIDRLLRSFSKVQAGYRLYLAGIDASDGRLNALLKQYDIRMNFFCLGKLNRSELAQYYGSVHVAFGSLALYKANLSMASTLKVKESIAYGRPVVVAYTEQDFYGNSAFDGLYLQLPNDATPIDFEKISDFARRFYADPGNQKRLHELALQTIDVDVKMKKFVSAVAAA